MLNHHRISKEQQSTIFEKFTQADGSAKRMYGGTGLGLAICDRIVAEHGGRMSVVSQSGSGACFRFGLPRVGAEDTETVITEL